MLGIKLDKKQQKQTIIGVIILAAVLFIYFKGKNDAGKGKAKNIPLPKDIIGGGSSVPASTNGDQTVNGTLDGGTIRRISTALHDDMDGYNAFGHDMRPYKDWVTLSSTGFVAVYNDFNDQYASENKGTLKKWLIDEMYRDSIVDDIILPKMAQYGLN